MTRQFDVRSMIKLRGMTGKEPIAALAQPGFHVQRIKGGRHFFKHADGRTALVPVHAGEEISSWR